MAAACRWPLRTPMRGGLTPSSALHLSGGCAPEASRQTWLLPPCPMGRALRPSTPGDFPVAEKVTKGAPRAAPFGIPRYEVSALFALAALRFGSRRATFYLRPRPICHFEIAEGIGLIFSPRLAEVTPPAFKPWRGRANWWFVLAAHSRGPIRDRSCWVGAQTAQTAHSFPNSLSLYLLFIMRFVGCTEAAQNLHKLHRTPVLCTTPPSPIPPFSPKVASKRATNPLPSHGLTAEYFSSLKPRETAQPIARTTSKWQLHLCRWQKAARRDA